MNVARVIPCLDVTDGRVVKGTKFVDLRDAGDAVELAVRYDAEGADELVFLDITASSDRRDTTIDMVQRVADEVFIPFTVGGGIRTAADARRMLRAGADKVAANTAAVERPELLAEIAAEFGAQCAVCAIDAKRRVSSDPGAGGPCTSTVGEPRLNSTLSSGRGARRHSAPARSCSLRWTVMARATGSTSSSPAQSPMRLAYR